MTVDIEAIARTQRCEASSLRIALPLLEQGYLPPFLARYRRDELGGIEESALWALLDAMRTEQRLQQRRDELLQRCQESGVADEAYQRVIHDARSQRVLDRVARRLRHEPSDPAQQLAARLLSPHSHDAEDIRQVAEQAVGPEAVEAAMAGLDRALTTRLIHDPRLTRAAVRWLAKHAKLSILEVADPHIDEPEPKAKEAKGKQAEEEATSATEKEAAASQETASAEAATKPADDAASPATTASPSSEDSALTGTAAAKTKPSGDNQSQEKESEPATAASATAPAASTTSEDADAETAPAAASATPEAGGSESQPSEAAAEAPSASSAEKPSEDAAKKSKGSKTKKGESQAKAKKKKISPRQRRRRWLVSVLQPLKGKTLPPGKLTAFQTVMLGRALRSDVVQCSFQYDASQLLEQLTKTAAGFNRGRSESLQKAVQENEAKIRELAEAAWWDELVDGAATRLVHIAAAQLRQQMLREPIDARIVLSIDAIGPKTSAVAIVTADGRLLHTEDVPCQLSAAMRQQTVTRLGELIHQYHVDLMVVSNGPARRAALVVLSELLEQSQPGSLCWTLSERSGADLYANGPAGNREMRSTPRRFRAATWLAFQAISPAQALTKVEPTKLRLGSFQRELADDALAEALGDVLVSGVSNDGVDVNSVDQAWLARLPGMSEGVAEAIHRHRRKQLFASRSELNALSEWPEEADRNQAIAFLRVFQSEQPLDGTLIHPDDYALAEKLAKSLEIPLPPAMPPGYQPPALDQADKADEDESKGSSEAEHEASPSEANDSAETAAETAVAPAEATATDSEGSGTTDATEAAGDSADASVTEPTEKQAEASETTVAEAIDSAANADQASSSSPAAAAEPDTSPAAADTSSAEETEESKDVTELKSFRESKAAAASDEEAKPAPPTVPEPYRHPRPEKDKIARLAKEWQIGPHRADQIVRWLCDPFTSGASRATAGPSAVMQRVPKLGELKQGDRVSGVVVGVAPFGVFVELGPDCNGLIHVSRLSESYVEDLHEAVQVGDVLVTWVTGVDSKRRRVALSAVSPEREAELAEQKKQKRGDGRRGGGRSGGPRGGQGGGASRGAGGPGGSGKRAQGGRRRDPRERGGEGKRRDQGPRVYNKVSKSKTPPPPITEAMQKGDEPLRTFGDLMQFFQQGKQEKKASSSQGTPAAQEPPPPSEPPAAESAAKPDDASPTEHRPADAAASEASSRKEPPASDPAVDVSPSSESPQER